MITRRQLWVTPLPPSEEQWRPISTVRTEGWSRGDCERIDPPFSHGPMTRGHRTDCDVLSPDGVQVTNHSFENWEVIRRGLRWVPLLPLYGVMTTHLHLRVGGVRTPEVTVSSIPLFVLNNSESPLFTGSRDKPEETMVELPSVQSIPRLT